MSSAKAPSARDVRAALAACATPAKARSSASFFKTGKGQYGEGDVFIGVTVPEQRKIARAHAALPLTEIEKLLSSKVHEERLTALLVLVRMYERGGEEARSRVYAFYTKNLRFVNNWDLVDSSAHQIVGTHLLTRKRDVLYALARSNILWERRVAMVATHAFIQAGESKDAFALAEILLNDEHDLMHKAVGWMLREVGKRVDTKALTSFLKKHAGSMPRTALRYAIEHYSPSERAAWLSLKPKR